MILSRRRVHFYSSIVLCCALPLVFLAGIIWRPRYETTSSADALFVEADFADPEKIGASIDVLSDNGVHITTFAAANSTKSAASIYLQLSPRTVLKQPQLLAYWQPASEPEDELSDRALLLGSLTGTASRLFPLSPETYGKEGTLLLYNPISQNAVVTLSFPAKMTKQP